jgi:hypothetical protein
MEVIFDDQLGEDHVGFCIPYCLNIVSIVMMIWKWSLFRTILDSYYLKEHLITDNEGHVLDVVKWEKF